ncbi:diguanylate cyclase [Sinorhizobium glycinis]|uniref:diguanylate cyclase n=1 Tax=Sinorhizobium glycinis TaxID=1472378 RepID=A0A178XTA8_9HYPH|nr:GGDEF domain-containing protein [Sinorhizobium glycinis]OAP38414.1 diguanylate cyclase [Sinorhizobium glycinis]
MSLFPAISITAHLILLPALLRLRSSETAGVREFSIACALSAIATALLMAATSFSVPLAAIAGYAAMILAIFGIFLGFRRLVDQSVSIGFCATLAFAAGTAGLLIDPGDQDGFGAHMIIIAGCGAAFLAVIGLPILDGQARGKPALRAGAAGLLAIAFAGLVRSIGSASETSLDLPASPASPIFDYSLAFLQVFFLPALFVAVILTIENRVIAGLRTMLARDPLTGALSRRALIEDGEQTIAACLTHHRPAAFLQLDLDYFKQINDHYGHACGDMALAHFVETVSAFLDGRGIFGRIGGEEFGIVLPDHTEEQAAAVAEAICLAVRDTPVGRAHQRIRLTVSIGIAAAAPGDTIMDVMIRADMALYDSKADGRDRCSIAKHRQIDASARVLAAAAAQLRQGDATHRDQLRHSA